jgi:excisionase family DNA binding protein
LPDQRFLSRDQVAEELNVTTAQVYALLRRGELRALQLGGRKTWRIGRDDLEAYIQRAYEETARWIEAHPFVHSEDEGDESLGEA